MHKLHMSRQKDIVIYSKHCMCRMKKTSCFHKIIPTQFRNMLRPMSSIIGEMINFKVASFERKMTFQVEKKKHASNRIFNTVNPS